MKQREHLEGRWCNEIIPEDCDFRRESQSRKSLNTTIKNAANGFHVSLYFICKTFIYKEFIIMSFIVKKKSVINFQIPHQAQLINISKDDQFVRFLFRVIDVPSRPYASGICPNVDLEPGTQLHKWFSIFNGSDLNEGDSVEEEGFFGSVMEVKLQESKDKNFINVVDVIS
jgi:hypothetical protein